VAYTHSLRKQKRGIVLTTTTALRRTTRDELAKVLEKRKVLDALGSLVDPPACFPRQPSTPCALRDELGPEVDGPEKSKPNWKMVPVWGKVDVFERSPSQSKYCSKPPRRTRTETGFNYAGNEFSGIVGGEGCTVEIRMARPQSS